MFEALLNDINSVIASTAWQTKGIEVVPENYFGDLVNPNEYCRITVLPGSSENRDYQGKVTLSGLVILRIFVKAGEGQNRVMQIADALNTVLLNTKLTNGTELGTSFVRMEGIDSDNSSLFGATYQINFKHYGE